MRVLQSVRYRWLAQTETWLYNQVRFLPDSVESHVVTRTIQNRDQFSVPHIYAQDQAAALRRAWDASLMSLRLRRYPGFLVERGRSLRVDLMHAHFGPWGWAVRGAARRLGVPLVVTFYGFDVNQLPLAQPAFRERYLDLFRDAAAILCEGEFMRQSIIRLGCPAEKAHVHRLGIDLDTIRFRPRSIDPNRKLRVLLASAFREKKGLPIAIEALGHIAKEVELEITLIGDASVLPASLLEKRRIQAAIRAAGLESAVTARGFQPHDVLLAEADRHDLFLCPSRTASDGDTEGGAPVALIEMAASGIPVVGTDHCDIPGVVRHGETGLLAREGDVDSMVSAIRQALELGSTWETMTHDARAHIEARFDARVQGERLYDRYRELRSA